MATEENLESPKTAATPESTNLPPPFLEVSCNSTGTVRRFAAGTEAGFAASLISQSNKSSSIPREVRIKAVKQGEEPVFFGPNAVLVNYGPSWKLQAVAVAFAGGGGQVQTPRLNKNPNSSKSSVLQPTGDEVVDSGSPISILYIGKVLVAFIFIFMIAAIFTLFLENLPQLLSFINWSPE